MPNQLDRKRGRLTDADELALAKLRELFVPHPGMLSALSDVRRSLELARHDHHITLFIGPTGVGKTAGWGQLRTEFDLDAERDSSPDRLGSIYLQLEPKGGAYHSAWLDRLLLIAADELLIERKQILPGPPGRRMISFRGTNEGRRQALLNVLRIRRPSVLAIDEAQHLGYLSGRGVQQALDDLKTLADASAVPLLFIGPYELAAFSSLSGQLARRTRDVHFPRYSGDREDWRSFMSTLQYIAMNVSFDFDPLERDASQYLYAGCIGCIGLLVRWIVRGFERCLRDGRRAISRADLEAEQWPAGRLQKQLTDIQTGEGTMRELGGDFDRLCESLGLKTQETKRRGSAKPGQRKPVRDITGSAIEPIDAATA